MRRTLVWWPGCSSPKLKFANIRYAREDNIEREVEFVTFAFKELYYPRAGAERLRSGDPHYKSHATTNGHRHATYMIAVDFLRQ